MTRPPLPSLTRTWHSSSYASIDVSRPELSCAGKRVVITGAGSGIGRAIAHAFARAGASEIILIGRNEASLRETQSLLSSQTSTSVRPADVTDEKALAEIAAAVGTWDVMVLAAGYIAKPTPVRESSVQEWWQCFETNVKGTMVSTNVFLPTANPTHAAIIGITAAVVLPVQTTKGMSAYISSKLSLVKVMEYIAAENPNVFAAALHPGMVNTKILRESGADPNKLPLDSDDLPADFTVWLTSPEAAFLNGRNVWANWDVDELKAKANEIQSGQLLHAGVYGWPFSPI